MKPLRVTAIQRGCVYDGPGVRTTVFLKGCTMKCPWCCNPEAISLEEQYFVDDRKCLFLKGIDSTLCINCERKEGNRSIHNCPLGVSECISKDYTSNELYALIERDFALMKSSGGGVTFSGGEPLLYIESLEPLLIELKTSGIDIAFETTLTTSEDSILKTLKYADTMIIDIKLQQEHVLGNSNDYKERLRKHINICRKHSCKLVFRIVFVDSMTNDAKRIVGDLAKLEVDELEVLKCHNLADQKYKKLSAPHINFSASSECLNSFVSHLEDSNITVSKLSI